MTTRAARRDGDQHRVGGVDDVVGPAGEPLDRRPAGALPAGVEQPDRDPAVDHPDARTQVGNGGGRRAVLPGTGEDVHAVGVGAGAAVARPAFDRPVHPLLGERPGQLVHVFADTGPLPQRGPVVDQDPHGGER